MLMRTNATMTCGAATGTPARLAPSGPFVTRHARCCRLSYRTLSDQLNGAPLLITHNEHAALKEALVQSIEDAVLDPVGEKLGLLG